MIIYCVHMCTVNCSTTDSIWSFKVCKKSHSCGYFHCRGVGGGPLDTITYNTLFNRNKKLKNCISNLPSILNRFFYYLPPPLFEFLSPPLMRIQIIFRFEIKLNRSWQNDNTQILLFSHGLGKAHKIIGLYLSSGRTTKVQAPPPPP